MKFLIREEAARLRLNNLVKNCTIWSSNLIIMMFAGLALLGCASHKPSPVTPAPTQATVPTPDYGRHYAILLEEIERLKKLVAEKDKLIHNQNVRQQDQDQVLQETTTEVTRTQVKLHRLATKPSAASTLAEVEVAMERLKQEKITAMEQPLQIQAQRLLNAAMVFYKHNEFAAAMNYATQAHEIINMVIDKNRRVRVSATSTVTFHTPIMLHTKTDVNLRKEPNVSAEILAILKKGTTLMANAYSGNWLRVLTGDEAQGWVFNTLLETQIGSSP